MASCWRARVDRRARSPTRSRRWRTRTGCSRIWSSKSGSRNGPATACCGIPCIWARETDKKARDVRREGRRREAARQARRGPKMRRRPRTGRTGRRAGRRTRTDRSASRRHPRPRQLARAHRSVLHRARRRAKKDGDLTLPDGDSLRVTNLAKVFWPKLGITKGELLRYYVRGLAVAAAGGGRPAAGHEAVSERRRQAGVLSAAPSRSRRRRACGARCCPTTSSRSAKKARAIG